MTPIVVGIADCQTSKDRNSTLVTYALGSCVGIGVFDPASKVGGLLHVLLPESSLDAEKAAKNPSMFADTGVAHLLNRCQELGASKSRLRVWLAGGSAVMDTRGVFNIGKRNQLAVRKALWKAGLLTLSEDLGGHGSRTVRLELGTGTFWIRAAGADQELKAKAGFAKGV
ncbi:MAG TPA: chemotaxis protein CheD [Bryobacteraceae bacterium]|jgi:chemotaxis protein CheD|nr:chemotaxis protein CheD [Bryobacteraceae bacterium]